MPFDKLTVLSKVEGPFDRLTALSKAEGPFDRLTVLRKTEGLRSASSFGTEADFYVRLIPQDLYALNLDLFLCRLISIFY